MAKNIKRQLEKYLKELEKEKQECDKWDTEKMCGMSYAYEQVIERLKEIINN